MAKYFGKIGFMETVETRPSVWEEQITERNYYGDVLQNSRRYQSSEHRNDNLVINNRISVVLDPYACENFHKLRYVEYMGHKWKADSVDVKYPRLIITLGGVYNGEEQN